MVALVWRMVLINQHVTALIHTLDQPVKQNCSVLQTIPAGMVAFV